MSLLPTAAAPGVRLVLLLALPAALLLPEGRSSAARNLPNVEGGYFGTVAYRSTVLRLDLTIHQQVGKRVSGQLDVGAMFPAVPVSGVVDSRGRLRLRGVAGESGLARNRSVLRIQGRYAPLGLDGQGTISGQLRVTGADRGRGAFSAQGGRTTGS